MLQVPPTLSDHAEPIFGLSIWLIDHDYEILGDLVKVYLSHFLQFQNKWKNHKKSIISKTISPKGLRIGSKWPQTTTSYSTFIETISVKIDFLHEN